jgi:uncharacterized protein YaiI (UPF0178 family)
MQIPMLVAVGTLFVVWIVTGVRLVRLARRTRALPEFLLGLSLLLQAGLGYPLSVVAQSAGRYELLLILVSALCTNTGMGLLYAFTARVFHDASRWAWALVGAAGALLAVQLAGHVLGQAAATTPEAKLSSILLWGAGSLALSGLSGGWTAFEALRFHALLRKRAALGLADPVVANRMLLWGLMGCCALAAVLIDAVLLYSGRPAGERVHDPRLLAPRSLPRLRPRQPPSGGGLSRARGRYAAPPPMVILFVDADACPVKDEVYSVAARHGVRVVLVSNMRMGVPPGLDVELVVVGRGLDAADDWIAEHAEAGDVVVTADIPLAARCLAAGAQVLGADGRPFTEDSIGGALATRALKSELRERGVLSGGPRPLADKDRSRFLTRLDQMLHAALRPPRG